MRRLVPRAEDQFFLTGMGENERLDLDDLKDIPGSEFMQMNGCSRAPN